ncbi:MAG: hypothetical protein GTO03_11505, partial [Planctomycetales bacterium]|nr:hypothetical protein [Planctomycetales bacterium]
MNRLTPGDKLVWHFALGLALVLLLAWGPACSEQRGPTRAGHVRQDPGDTPRLSAADDYVSRAVLDMAAEDQERSAQ